MSKDPEIDPLRVLTLEDARLMDRALKSPPALRPEVESELRRRAEESRTGLPPKIVLRDNTLREWPKQAGQARGRWLYVINGRSPEVGSFVSYPSGEECPGFLDESHGHMWASACFESGELFIRIPETGP